MIYPSLPKIYPFLSSLYDLPVLSSLFSFLSSVTRSRRDNTSATISNVDLYSNKFPSKAEYTVQKWIVPYLYLRTCFIFSIRIYFFFSIEFHRVHAFDTFFVGGNALAYHLIKPFQSSRLSMKNKPTEKEREKKDKEGNGTAHTAA